MKSHTSVQVAAREEAPFVGNALGTNRRSISRTILLLGGLVVSAATAAQAPSSGIRVYAENPFYWEYQGKPVLLLGGSSGPKGALNDEGMFLWPEVIGSLDSAGVGCGPEAHRANHARRRPVGCPGSSQIGRARVEHEIDNAEAESPASHHEHE